jgi:threonine/homoserine/homoserine lactone efflux protein
VIVNLWAFIGISLLIVIAPGPDTVLVTKNALIHGRITAFATVAGISVGLLVWTAAAALGIAALVRESAIAFTVLKLAGALYLIWLGLNALRAARRPSTAEPGTDPKLPAGGGAPAGFRQGLLCNLANPKIGVFFTSLLPQFVAAHHPVLVPFLALGGVFSLMGLTWLCGYVLLATRLADALRRPRVKAALDSLTGVVLIGVGIRLALEHR